MIIHVQISVSYDLFKMLEYICEVDFFPSRFHLLFTHRSKKEKHHFLVIKGRFLSFFIEGNYNFLASWQVGCFNKLIYNKKWGWIKLTFKFNFDEKGVNTLYQDTITSVLYLYILFYKLEKFVWIQNKVKNLF